MQVPKKFIYWKNWTKREYSFTAGLTYFKQLTDSIKYLWKNVNYFLTEGEVFTGKSETETLSY